MQTKRKKTERDFKEKASCLLREGGGGTCSCTQLLILVIVTGPVPDFRFRGRLEMSLVFFM